MNETKQMKYTEFDLVDFANYVLNNRRMSSQNGDVGHNEFINWLEVRKPQEFIRKVREYKIDLLIDDMETTALADSFWGTTGNGQEKNGGYSYLTDSDLKQIDDELEDRFKK